MSQYKFTDRHIGPDNQETKEMLSMVGVSSIEELISKTIPADIRLKNELNIPEAVDESSYFSG